jgi:hypothetical protein
MIFVLMCASGVAHAASLLQLPGEGRIVNIYTSYEIPDYLRTSQCNFYAYEQKFGNVIISGSVSYAPSAGTTPEDISVLREHSVCVLRLRREAMLKGTVQPVTIYEIDLLGRGSNEIHAGQNHRAMDRGKYELEDGTKFSVKNNIASGLN